MCIYTSTTHLNGPPPPGHVTLILPRADDALQGRFVIPTTVSVQPEEAITVHFYTTSPQSIHPGQIIGQLVTVPCLIPQTGPVAAAVTTIESDNRPLQSLWIGGVQLTGLFDTGSDLTIIPPHLWNPHWGTQASLTVWGIGGHATPTQSVEPLPIKEQADMPILGYVRPVKLASPHVLWGRDVLTLLQAKLVTSLKE